MRGTLITLFVAVMMSSTAVSSTFSLGPYTYPTGDPAKDAPWPYAAMITWTSPAHGAASISGVAWPTSGTASVWLELVPFALASNLNPDNVLQIGTTPLVNGTVQYPYQSPGNPAAFGSVAIPLRGYVSSLSDVPVEAGDVIAVLIENGNLFSGDTDGLNFSVQFPDDFQQQGPAGSLTTPQAVTGEFTGIAGSLKPSSNHSSDAFEFFWPTYANFSGAAATDLIFQNGAGAGGFLNGLELGLYSFPSLRPIGNWIVLDSSATLSSFDFGPLSPGNYVLQVVDRNSEDDPPYSIRFNGSIGAPVSSTTPEPGTTLLLSAGLVGLAVRRWRLARRP